MARGGDYCRAVRILACVVAAFPSTAIFAQQNADRNAQGADITNRAVVLCATVVLEPAVSDQSCQVIHC